MILADLIQTQPIHNAYSGEVLTMDRPLPAAKVVADEVWRMFWQGAEKWDMLRDFGPLRPPFDEMWIEGRLPAWGIANGERRVFSKSDRETIQGCHVVTLDNADGTFSVCANPLIGNRRTKIVAIVPGVHRIVVDQDGKYILRRTEFDRAQFPGMDDRTVEEVIWTWTAPAYLTLGLMNCKNVGLEQVRPQLSKRQMRLGEKRITYSKIRLPTSARSASNTREAQESVGRPEPYHLIRGHFKTYTDEAPLFGRHTGTYWWSWQARGDQKHGERHHEYEVGPLNQVQDDHNRQCSGDGG